MHERTIYTVLPQGQTVQKGWSNPHSPPQGLPANHTLII